MNKLTLSKILGHWRTIRLHRKWARYYCFLAGIPWRGIKHDLSKYSPIEFFESACFYTGTSSPIEEAKKNQGYSRAWLHHRGHNPHHWAYWADNFSEGLTIYPMPKDDFVEMVCDFLAAGRAYKGNNFTYSSEYEWWKIEREKGCKAMNQENKIMLNIIFSDLACAEEQPFLPSPKKLIKCGYIQEVWRANHKRM